jgi:hypothetical protein
MPIIGYLGWNVASCKIIGIIKVARLCPYLFHIKIRFKTVLLRPEIPVNPNIFFELEKLALRVAYRGA